MSEPTATTPRMEPPDLDIDPYTPETITSPYAFFAALREHPVVRIKPYGFYAVGRHEECKTVLTDHTRFMTKAGIGIQDVRKGGNFRIPNPLLENDPPVHTQIRGAISKLLSPLVIRRWRERFEQEAAILADQLVAQGEFDGVSDLAETFVLNVFAGSVGVRLPRTEALTIGNMRFNQAGPPNQLFHAAMERAAPYLQWYESSILKENMLPGSIGEMVYAAEERGELPMGSAKDIVRVFVGGGVDTTVSSIGYTLYHLASNPDQWNIVKADPSKVSKAFDEAVRLDPPSYTTFRTTTRDLEFEGYALKGDTKVGVFVGAPNRDPRKWESPDVYDIGRDSAGIHLGFGTSAHACLGQMIARFEAEAIIRALVTRVQKLEFAAAPVHRPVNQLRTMDRIPLRVVA